MGVSIVCVFNNREVLEDCLIRSIESSADNADVELVPVDNRNHSFPTAGAALNFGASKARYEAIAFVHQDVYLHSLAALGRACSMVISGEFGMLGALGVDQSGALRGRIRDRVILSGRPAPRPVDVESLDEVLFVLARDQWLQDPITSAAELAWHAYAVEYGARVRSHGGRVGAVDIPLTHNSLTINLDRLDVAHRAVAVRYPRLVPLRTTCGSIRHSKVSNHMPSWVRRNQWRYRWLRESLEAYRMSGRDRELRVVLSDIRRSVDAVAAAIDGPLRVLNLDEGGAFSRDGGNDLQLKRWGSIFEFRSAREFSQQSLRDLDNGESLLITNLSRRNCVGIRELLPTALPRLAGFHDTIGAWVLLGPAALAPVAEWNSRRSRPKFLGR